MLLKIDPLMVDMYHGMYVRVLVDIDFTHELPDKILVKMKHKESKIDESFFMGISYKKIPNFCQNCNVFSHDMVGCKRIVRAALMNRASVGRSLNETSDIFKKIGDPISQLGGTLHQPSLVAVAVKYYIGSIDARIMRDNSNT